MTTRILLLLLIPCLSGCLPPTSTMDQGSKIWGKSVVLAGTVPAKLAFQPVVKGSIVVRNQYRPDASGVLVYDLFHFPTQPELALRIS